MTKGGLLSERAAVTRATPTPLTRASLALTAALAADPAISPAALPARGVAPRPGSAPAHRGLPAGRAPLGTLSETGAGTLTEAASGVLLRATDAISEALSELPTLLGCGSAQALANVRREL